MVDRIIRIMEREGLTSSRFAETIGIQRSAMSHIINRRNNVSLDVVMKILEKFSYVSPDWLILGKGEMMKEHELIETSISSNTGVILNNSTDLFEKKQENIVETPSIPTQYSKYESVIHMEKSSKNISKIMIFYSDDTFETFTSEKNK